MSRRPGKDTGRATPVTTPPPEIVPPSTNESGIYFYWRREEWASALLLMLATILAYLPVRHAGFIWDDEMHLTQNTCIIGPLGLKEIWTTAAARYFPLTLTTFWVEHALWGMNPLPFHLVNILLHGACAVALWRVLLILDIPGAWLGAACWALHPVQVETAAWITEMKNTESGLFYLLTVLCFVRWARSQKNGSAGRARWYYSLTLIFAVLALASKSSTVILPAVLALCLWWNDGKWQWRKAARLVPVVLLAAAASILTLWTQHLEGANEPEWMRPWPERLAVAGHAFWFYLGKLAWPHPLIFIYPRWQVDPAHLAGFLPTAAMAALLAILWWGRNGKLRPFFFAAAYFLAALLPVLGLVDGYFWRYSFVGDHFQYLASIGPLALAAAGLTRAFGLLGKFRRFSQPGFCGLLLLLLGVLSWRQCPMYFSIESLWRTTVERNPACWLAYNNLGAELLDQGKDDEAAAVLQKGIEIGPNFPAAYANLGNVLLHQNRFDAALVQYQKSVELDPDNVLTLTNLANTMLQTGRTQEAFPHVHRALAIDPDFAKAHTILGNAWLQSGRAAQAVDEYQKALELDPRNVESHTNLGTAALQLGRREEAVAHFHRALALNPNFVIAHINLANAFLQSGQMDAALDHYRRAVAISPQNCAAWNNLGYTLLQLGRRDEAKEALQRALAIDPTDPEVQRNLFAAERAKAEPAGFPR